MALIHESRNVGLYALCDICDKARYLPHIKDPLDLPDKWYCAFNPDEAHNKCSDPEELYEDEDYLINNLYNAGSIVWAKMDGYPWWPSMVDDDPVCESYFWLEGNSMTPTWYHVTFFDSAEVSRAWLRPSCIKPFKINVHNAYFRTSETNKYKSRVDIALQQACDAIELPLLDRLKKYSFICRYKKPLKSSKMTQGVVGKRKQKKQRQTKSSLLKNQQKKNIEIAHTSKDEDFNDFSFSFNDPDLLRTEKYTQEWDILLNDKETFQDLNTTNGFYFTTSARYYGNFSILYKTEVVKWGLFSLLNQAY
ncbi:hypothetical protein NQ317_007771 [Molorchus minor]|uniref:Zinc finger CW-type PWWP domain protein 1 n=1 Tax=Molorchus minor TaxID=1323400 RepID=A0ABQ9JWL6_9CUCU|nr:hypothetical protein NQ317_007771 [Molorchus minor]